MPRYGCFFWSRCPRREVVGGGVAILPRFWRGDVRGCCSLPAGLQPRCRCTAKKMVDLGARSRSGRVEAEGLAQRKRDKRDGRRHGSFTNRAFHSAGTPPKPRTELLVSSFICFSFHLPPPRFPLDFVVVIVFCVARLPLGPPNPPTSAITTSPRETPLPNATLPIHLNRRHPTHGSTLDQGAILGDPSCNCISGEHHRPTRLEPSKV